MQLEIIIGSGWIRQARNSPGSHVVVLLQMADRYKRKIGAPLLLQTFPYPAALTCKSIQVYSWPVFLFCGVYFHDFVFYGNLSTSFPRLGACPATLPKSDRVLSKPQKS